MRHSLILVIKMSHPFGLLLRGAREAGFTEGLQAGHQEVEKELAGLGEYVEQLKVSFAGRGTGEFP
jgi:hypothetical protein